MMLPVIRLLSPIFGALLLAPALAFGQVTLDVAGDDADLRDALTAASVLMRPAEDGQTVPPGDRVAAARAEYGRLLGVLYDRGFFAPEISVRVNGREAARMSPFAAPARIDTIAIRVTPGRPFMLGTADIGPLAPGDRPAEGFASGQPATTGILRDAASAGIYGWRAVGHATADIASQDITARNREALLDARIAIDPGPQLTFGRLIATGLNRMPAARLREIAGLPTGQTYSPEELARAADRLRRTGVFSSVALSDGPVAGDSIDIDAALVEAPLRRFGFGAEISSQEGLSLSAYWLHRNLTGGGERLRFDAEITGIGQDAGDPDAALTATFSRPATATPDTTFRAIASAEFLDEDTFRELVFDVTAGIEQQISDDLTGEIGIGLRFSDISDAFGDRQVTLVTLPTGVTLDRRDDTLDARTGYYVDAGLTPFLVTGAGAFGARASVDARGYLGFGAARATRLAGRLQIGTVTGGAITDLPPDYLFYSGGGGTVRGHDYRSLGAVQDGVASGGRGFVGLSGELRHDFTDTIGFVAFYDAGYVSADEIGDTSGTWHSGAGLGLRYATPFGAIRLDVAVPVSGPDPASDVHLYIGIGQSF